jgi:hypothetical protein
MRFRIGSGETMRSCESWSVWKSSRNSLKEDEGAGQQEEGEVDVGSRFPSHQQPSKASQPGEGPFDCPPPLVA